MFINVSISIVFLGHLPPARRVHQEGEGDEEASLRPHQAHGHARRGQGKAFLISVPTYIISPVSCLILGQPRIGSRFTFKRNPILGSAFSRKPTYGFIQKKYRSIQKSCFFFLATVRAVRGHIYSTSVNICPYSFITLKKSVWKWYLRTGASKDWTGKNCKICFLRVSNGAVENRKILTYLPLFHSGSSY